MRNEVIIQKLLGYTEKILEYCRNFTYTDFPWRDLYGLRNRIVHDYEGVNLRLIWEIISEDLEPLRQTLQKMT